MIVNLLIVGVRTRDTVYSLVAVDRDSCELGINIFICRLLFLYALRRWPSSSLGTAEFYDAVFACLCEKMGRLGVCACVYSIFRRRSAFVTRKNMELSIFFNISLGIYFVLTEIPRISSEPSIVAEQTMMHYPRLFDFS